VDRGFARPTFLVLLILVGRGFARPTFLVLLILVGHTITVVPSLSAARTTLAGNEFDIVMIDYNLDA
jgi:hypothetical protein